MQKGADNSLVAKSSFSSGIVKPASSATFAKGIGRGGRNVSEFNAFVLGGLQETDMSGLLKVAVRGEGFPYSLILHDDKARTVGEPPVLVRPIFVKLPSPDEPVSIDVDDGDPLGRKDGVQESDNGATVGRPGKAVGHLCEDVIGCNVVRSL